MNQSGKEQLEQLADKWLASAKQGYVNAERMHEPVEDRPTGREMTELGAICEYNCAKQLKDLLSSLSVSSLKTSRKMKSKKRSQSL